MDVDVLILTDTTDKCSISVLGSAASTSQQEKLIISFIKSFVLYIHDVFLSHLKK